MFIVKDKSLSMNYFFSTICHEMIGSPSFSPFGFFQKLGFAGMTNMKKTMNIAGVAEEIIGGSCSALAQPTMKSGLRKNHKQTRMENRSDTTNSWKEKEPSLSLIHI